MRAVGMMYTARGIADTTRNVLSAPVAAYAQSETASADLRAAMMDNTGKVSAQYKDIDNLATRLGDRLPGTTADFKNLMTMLIRQGMSAQTVLGGTGEAAALLAVQLKKAPKPPPRWPPSCKTQRAAQKKKCWPSWTKSNASTTQARTTATF